MAMFQDRNSQLCQEITAILLPAERLKNRSQFYFIFQELQTLISVTLKPWNKNKAIPPCIQLSDSSNFQFADDTKLSNAVDTTEERGHPGGRDG